MYLNNDTDMLVYVDSYYCYLCVSQNEYFKNFVKHGRSVLFSLNVPKVNYLVFRQNMRTCLNRL